MKRNRGRALLYDTELVGKLADMQLQDEQLDDRRDALADCVRKLPAGRQELLRRYYRGEESAARIAEQDGVTRQAIFSRLRVIRVALLDCINQSLGNLGVVDG